MQLLRYLLKLIFLFSFVALPLSAIPMHKDPVIAREHGINPGGAIMPRFEGLQDRGFGWLSFIPKIAKLGKKAHKPNLKKQVYSLFLSSTPDFTSCVGHPHPQVPLRLHQHLRK